jgi:hypothetical protein
LSPRICAQQYRQQNLAKDQYRTFISSCMKKTPGTSALLSPEQEKAEDLQPERHNAKTYRRCTDNIYEDLPGQVISRMPNSGKEHAPIRVRRFHRTADIHP